MIIIADSGSTKCTWLFHDGGKTTSVRTRGINALQHTPEQIRETLAALPPCGPVSAVHIYSAGCSPAFPVSNEKLRRELEARFGTGANSCHCRDGEVVHNVSALGYVLGDEGSGAVLGRNLVNGIFKEHIPLRGEFLEACGMTYEEIIRRVYNEPFANRFLASFAPFSLDHIGCPEVRRMVLRSFGDFAERNLSRYPKGLPVSFVGGIAAHFGELLREALAGAGYEVKEIIKSPAEGLLKYHHGK